MGFVVIKSHLATLEKAFQKPLGGAPEKSPMMADSVSGCFRNEGAGGNGNMVLLCRHTCTSQVVVAARPQRGEVDVA